MEQVNDTTSDFGVPEQRNPIFFNLFLLPDSQSQLLFLKLEFVTSEKTIDALLDTGAGVNVISEASIKALELGALLEKDKEITFRTATGQTVVGNKSIIATVRFSIGNVELSDTIKFHVVPSLARGVILGVQFMQKHLQLIADVFGRKPSSGTEKSDEHTSPAQVECQMLMRKAFGKAVGTEEEVDMCGFIQVLDTDTQVVDQENSQVEHILTDYADVITDESPSELPPKRNITHRIVVYPGALPTYRAQYRLTLLEKQELARQVDELLKQGFIRKSMSPYNSPVLFVKKKDGSLRMCVDYRALNNITIKNKFPIPRIDEALDKIGGARVFSKMDLRSGFYQIRVAPEDIEKTAFSSDRNHFEFTVMPFGLTNAPARFQTVMNEVLKDYVDKFVLVYIDDILIFSKDEHSHARHLKLVMDVLRKNQLVAKRSKCEFFKDKLQFLGYVISKDGIHTDPEKISKVRDWPTPTSAKEVQSFLGLTGFYRRFIKDYSKITSCLTDYAAKKVIWSDAQQTAFELLKDKLTHSPILVAPCFEQGYSFRVSTDACDSALGYVLEQLDPGGKLVGVIAYGSKKLDGASLNYPIREKEFLAVICALQTWRHYLMNRRFIIRTDHHSLQYWKQQDAKTNQRIAKWNDILAQFDCDLQYLPGSRNSVADALSRKPDASSDETYTDDDRDIDMLISELTEVQSTDHQVHLHTDLPQLLIDGYSSDADFGEIYDILVNQKVIPPTLNHHITHFSVKDDKLLYFDDYRICVPHVASIKEKILYLCHDLPTGGHFGKEKTYLAVAKSFYWKNMKKFIENYVRTCDTCQRVKSSTISPHGFFSPLPIPLGRWTHITMDFVTGIPSTRGYRYDAILVVVDRFSKRARFIPTYKSFTSKDTAMLYLQYIFSQHGVPRHITSDKDIKFMSAFWRQIHLSLGSELIFTTTNHPQADGQSERTVKIVNQLLRSYCQEHYRDWDTLLPMIEFAYNSTYQRSVDGIPFEIDLGYVPPGPAQVNALAPKYNSFAALDLKTKLLGLQRQVQDSLVSAQATQERQVNSHRSSDKFAVGDYVLLHQDAMLGVLGKYVKLKPVYFGPYKLVSQVGSHGNAFEVDFTTATRRHRTVNVSFFRRYHARGLHYPDNPPVTNHEATARIADIVAIVGYDSEDDEVAVTWSGCDPKHATRIPARLLVALPRSRLRQLLQQAGHIPDLPSVTALLGSTSSDDAS